MSTRLLLLGCLIALAVVPALSAAPKRRRSPVFRAKTANGQAVVNPTIFPYTASIKYKVGASEPYVYCSGSLIATQWVLTAARCLQDGNGTPYEPPSVSIEIQLPWAPQAPVASIKGQAKALFIPSGTVENIPGGVPNTPVAYTGYNASNLLDGQTLHTNDVGLIQLTTPITNPVTELKLYDVTDDNNKNKYKEPGANVNLAVIGFGQTTGAGFVGNLNVGTVAYIGVAGKTANYNATSLTQAGNVPTSMSPCQGDYGAPLVNWQSAADPPAAGFTSSPAVNNPANHRLVGLFSNGPNCGAQFAVGQYTLIGGPTNQAKALRSWIAQRIEENGGSTPKIPNV